MLDMYSTIRAVSGLIWSLCGGNVVAFLQIAANFASSVCLDLHSLICYSLGRNKGLTLKGWAVSTNRRPANKQSYLSLCMDTYLLSSSGNTVFSHPLFICSLFYKKDCFLVLLQRLSHAKRNAMLTGISSMITPCGQTAWSNDLTVLTWPSSPPCLLLSSFAWLWLSSLQPSNN